MYKFTRQRKTMVAGVVAALLAVAVFMSLGSTQPAVAATRAPTEPLTNLPSSEVLVRAAALFRGVDPACDQKKGASSELRVAFERREHELLDALSAREAALSGEPALAHQQRMSPPASVVDCSGQPRDPNPSEDEMQVLKATTAASQRMEHDEEVKAAQKRGFACAQERQPAAGASNDFSTAINDFFSRLEEPVPYDQSGLDELRRRHASFQAFVAAYDACAKDGVLATTQKRSQQEFGKVNPADRAAAERVITSKRQHIGNFEAIERADVCRTLLPKSCG